MKTIQKFGAAAFLGALSLSAAASAADLPSRLPPPIAPLPILVSGWDGFYAGSTYGYGFTDFRTSQGISREKDKGGQIGGGLVGYNFQTGHFVYGAEGSIDLNVIRTNIPGSPALTASRVDSLYDLRFRGRLGYEFGWFMPFVAGGAVVNETYQSFSAGGVPYGEDKRSVGWTAGAGVDVKLNPRSILPFLPESFFGPLILRGEYIHDSLPREAYTIGPVGAQNTFRTKTDSNLFRLALIYRFGDVAPRPYADALGNVNWGGGYGGLFGGYGSVDTKTRSGTFGNTKVDSDGGIGGLYAGSNFMFFNNKVMLGFEGATAFSDITGKGTEPVFGDRTSYREYVNADIRGRVGYAFGNILPFAAAGVVFTRNEQRDPVTGSELGRIPVDNWTVGGGIDYRISQRVSLRGEYLYEKNFTNKLVNLNGCADCKQDRDSNVVRFGAAYHFE